MTWADTLIEQVRISDGETMMDYTGTGRKEEKIPYEEYLARYHGMKKPLSKQDYEAINSIENEKEKTKEKQDEIIISNLRCWNCNVSLSLTKSEYEKDDFRCFNCDKIQINKFKKKFDKDILSRILSSKLKETKFLLETELEQKQKLEFNLEQVVSSILVLKRTITTLEQTLDLNLEITS